MWTTALEQACSPAPAANYQRVKYYSLLPSTHVMDTVDTAETLWTDAHLCEGIQEVSSGFLLIQILHVLLSLWHRCGRFKKKKKIHIKNSYGAAVIQITIANTVENQSWSTLHCVSIICWAVKSVVPFLLLPLLGRDCCFNHRCGLPRINIVKLVQGSPV